ncbi:MAG: aldo/keto reductase [Ruminococcus sp.]|nr:aldo/keto reductase [Ruminococcus sp.]MCM1392131.1 aldo/keto reductase [Ruminococcus sp.]
MTVEAYSPVAHGEMLKNPTVTELAKKYRVTTAQLCIRYTLQLGTVALPKTANPAHMRENSSVDFVISDDDIMLLNTMEQIKDYGEYSIFPVFGGKKN